MFFGVWGLSGLRILLRRRGFFFSSPPQHKPPKKSLNLTPVGFQISLKLTPAKFENGPNLTPVTFWNVKNCTSWEVKKKFPLKSWFLHKTKKKPKLFGRLRRTIFFPLHPSGVFNPKILPRGNRKTSETYSPWDSKNLWILHPRVEEGWKKNKTQTNKLTPKAWVFFRPSST